MVVNNGRVPLSLEGIERALAGGGTAADRRAYLASLRKRIASYEKRYRLPSALLRDALASHKLGENLDVVKWIHAHGTLVDLENGREARLEQSRGLPSRHAAGGRG